MDDTLPTFLIYALQVAAHYKYVLVFFGSLIEGPILMIASGFLLHKGVFEFWPLYISLVLGDVAGDIVWYYIGYFQAERFIKKFGKFFGLTIENFEKVKSIFFRHHRKIIFFSKLTMGFGLAIYILMVAGATKVRMNTYLIINTIGEFFFALMLLALGFYFGKIYTTINEGLKIGFIIITALVLVVVISNVQKHLRERTLKL